MTFYNIVWLTVFILGGVTVGIIGLAHIEYFTILLVNPSIVDELLGSAENYYSSRDNLNFARVFVPHSM